MLQFTDFCKILTDKALSMSLSQLCLRLLNQWQSWQIYMMLPKNSGNFNRAPALVVVSPSSARCG